MALGKRDGWYRAYYQKNTSLYENLAKSLEDLAPWQLEIEVGNHFLHWGMSTMALLMAGGEAQIICLLEMVPMLALVVYFFRCDEKVYAIISSAFVGALCYFGAYP